ncbi:hypothetical protein DdX_20121 [Ditylenchus destructor]|uniref:Uncharacterized protein n=1 Tax=Ditylenchus destructor TaxID=166010 RepID=A0AAD4QWT7_9BILA|nr:hypothetical protein DdX_20121 [Ditylenchus destructor]
MEHSIIHKFLLIAYFITLFVMFEKVDGEIHAREKRMLKRTITGAAKAAPQLTAALNTSAAKNSTANTSTTNSAGGAESRVSSPAVRMRAKVGRNGVTAFEITHIEGKPARATPPVKDYHEDARPAGSK